jgi:hypothetical protein
MERVVHAQRRGVEALAEEGGEDTPEAGIPELGEAEDQGEREEEAWVQPAQGGAQDVGEATARHGAEVLDPDLEVPHVDEDSLGAAEPPALHEELPTQRSQLDVRAGKGDARAAPLADSDEVLDDQGAIFYEALSEADADTGEGHDPC